MPEVMVRPNWPSAKFYRTVAVGKKGKSRRIEFSKHEPTEVTDEEFSQLSGDIGNALFEVARDEKGRVRLLEPQAAEASAEAQPEG